MVTSLVYLAQFSIGTVFALAAILKLPYLPQTAAVVRRYEIVPEVLSSSVAVLIVLMELALSISHITGWGLVVLAPAGILLLISFTLAVGVNLARGSYIECGCFGASSETISPRSMVRLATLLLVEGVVTRHAWSFSPALNTPPPEATLAPLAVWIVGVAAVLMCGMWCFAAQELLYLLRERRYRVAPSSLRAR